MVAVDDPDIEDDVDADDSLNTTEVIDIQNHAQLQAELDAANRKILELTSQLNDERRKRLTVQAL